MRLSYILAFSLVVFFANSLEGGEKKHNSANYDIHQEIDIEEIYILCDQEGDYHSIQAANVILIDEDEALVSNENECIDVRFQTD